MRKTIIAIIVLIASFEKAKGQEWWGTIDYHSPAVNVFVGANAGFSLWIWRFEVAFGQLGHGLMLFEDKRIRSTENHIHIDTIGLARNMWNLRGGALIWGIGFKITERDIIRIGMDQREHISTEWRHGRGLGVFFEYVHRRNLSQRTSLDLSLGGIVTIRSWEYSGVEVAVRWNYELLPNLTFGIRLGYQGMFFAPNTPWWSETGFMYSWSGTRNFIDFTVGLHYNIQILNPFSTNDRVRTSRPPRQRVAPHQRALPCPPGQMRHNRSWDRPSSVFNHPSGR